MLVDDNIKQQRNSPILVVGHSHSSALLKAVRAEQLARRIEVVTAATPKFGCLMAMLPSLDSELPNFAADNIPADTLAEDGIETETHTTVLYGFPLDFDIDRLKKCLAGAVPFTITLGDLTRFDCPEYDVLKFDVASPELESLNAKLMAEFGEEITNNHKDYHAHVTVAYVKKGTNKNLDGGKFDGRKLRVSQLLYSLPEKAGRVVIDLKSLPVAASAHKPIDERTRYANHIAAQNEAEEANRRAVRKALAYAEVAVQEGKAKDEDGKKELLALLLLLLLGGSAAAYAQAHRRMGLEAGLPAPATKAQEEAFAAQRGPLLQPFLTRVVDELELERKRGVALEETAPELSHRLATTTEQLEGRDGERVAQTEAQAAYGSANLNILRKAGFKTVAWVTMDDERVRESHRQCEEVGPIPIGHVFPNGLRYPGDPNGGPEEVCNCRCWLVGVARR